jgi:hypothetical protein
MTGATYFDFEALHRLLHPTTPEDDPVIDPDIYHDDPDRDRPFDYTLDDPDRDRCDV